MEGLRLLMERYWIDRRRNSADYYRVRRESNAFRAFVTERLGWKLIVNEHVIKIEKVPAAAVPSMGIAEFKTTLDYIFLCAVLIFLEDQNENGQFLLSELTDYVEIQVKDLLPVDWTRFSDRRALIRVLKYLEDMGMLVAYEGEIEGFNSGQGEVLYENTGLCRYFATNFTHSMADCKSSRDFEMNPWQDLDADRGRLRTQRVYRSLMSLPSLSWSESTDADAIYLKNQRSSISAQFEKYLGGQLHIHKNAACFMVDEEDSWGEMLPNGTALSACILLFCGDLRRRIINQGLAGPDERVRVPFTMAAGWVLEGRKDHGRGYSKGLRDLNDEALVEAVFDEMEKWGLAVIDGPEVVFLPMAGKFSGEYPPDFDEEAEDE